MYETVKEVNGYAIQRMKGTRGHFRIYITEGKFVTSGRSKRRPHLPKRFNSKPAGRTTTGPTPEQAFSAEVMISVYREGEQQ